MEVRSVRYIDFSELPGVEDFHFNPGTISWGDEDNSLTLISKENMLKALEDAYEINEDNIWDEDRKTSLIAIEQARRAIRDLPDDIHINLEQ